MMTRIDPHFDPGESASKHIRTKSLHWCPKLTRLKLSGLVAIVTVAAMLVAFQCLNPSALQRGVFSCCPNSKQMITLTEKTTTVDTAYGGGDRIRYKHTKRRLPHCLIIGARKAGTRALLQFLDLHPQIQIAKKEVHFFDVDDNYLKGFDWYRRQMPYSFPGQITIEKTPHYLIDEDTPERVYRMNKTMKLLVILRDPTERLISDYTQIHENKIAKKKFSAPFEELVIDPETDEIRRSYNPVKRSLYHRHIERWLNYFPMKQFHFVNGENLVNTPVYELQKVEQFLGLEHRITDDSFCFNETKGFYCICNSTSQRCLAQSKGRKHPYISPQIIKRLQDFFRPHNMKLYQMIGRNFHWP